MGVKSVSQKVEVKEIFFISLKLLDTIAKKKIMSSNYSASVNYCCQQ